MVGLSVTPTLLCIKERRSIALARHWLDEVLSGSIGPDRGARALHEAARRKHHPARLPRAGLRASRHRGRYSPWICLVGTPPRNANRLTWAPIQSGRLSLSRASAYV